METKREKKTFSGVVTPASVLKNPSNPVTYSDYVQFWQSLQKSQHGAPNRFLIEILNKFIELEKAATSKAVRAQTGSNNSNVTPGFSPIVGRVDGNARKSEYPGNSAEKNASPSSFTLNNSSALLSMTAAEQQEMENLKMLWCLVNVFRFVDLFSVIDGKDINLKNALKKYEMHRLENKTMVDVCLELDEAVRNLTRNKLEKNDITNTLVIQVAFVNSIESAIMATHLSTSTRDLTFSILCQNSYTWIKLQTQLARGGEEARRVFMEIVKLLGSMPALLKSKPAILNTTLSNIMSLLIMIKEAVSIYPFCDSDVLMACSQALRPFISWPKPYCFLAGSIQDIVQGELTRPGKNLRERLKSENPLLDKFGASQSSKYGSQGNDWAKYHRTVVVMHNPQVARIQSIRRLFTKGQSLVDHNRGISAALFLAETQMCKEEILACVMEVCFKNKKDHAGWAALLIQSIKNKQVNDVMEWYEQAMLAVPCVGLINETLLLATLKKINPALVSPDLHPRAWLKRSDGSTILLQQQQQQQDDYDEDEDDFLDAGGGNNNGGKIQSVFEAKVEVDQTCWGHVVPRAPQLVFDFLEISSTVLEAGGLFSEHQASVNLFSGGGNGAKTDSPLMIGQPGVGGVPPGGRDPSRGSGVEKKEKLSLLPLRRRSKNANPDIAGTLEANAKEKKRGGGRASISVPGLDVFANNPIFSAENTNLLGVRGTSKCPQQYLFFPADYEELLRDCRALFPPDYVEGNKEEVNAATGRMKSKKPILKRIILGSHDVLHRAVITYTTLRALEPALCNLIEFRYYLIPVGKNDLAAFIAQRDAWYRRQVFCPFVLPFNMTPLTKLESSLAQSLGGADDSYETASGAGPDTPRAGGGGGGGDRNPKESTFGQFTSSRQQPSPSNLTGDGTESSSLNRDYFGGGFKQKDEPDKEHYLDVNPGRFLKHLAGNYVRSAEYVFPVNIYDCECWETPDGLDADARSCDLTIPFAMSVELGLNAGIAEFYQENPPPAETDDELALDSAPSFEATVVDKNFLKKLQSQPKNICADISVSIYPMDVDGTLHAEEKDRIDLSDGSYLQLHISNVSKYSLPLPKNGNTVQVCDQSMACNPSFPSLELQILPQKTSLLELIKKKDKKPRDIDQIRELFKLESRYHYAGIIDIRASASTMTPFSIVVDGSLFGPYYRVRIRTCSALSASGGRAVKDLKHPTNKLIFPLMTFFPLETFSSEENKPSKPAVRNSLRIFKGSSGNEMNQYL